jgi:2-polyprenyl-6-methoxyphenol hydroxylase-like FAD-dependent oxidoreductase
MSKRVSIVGAGPGGLAEAMLLARAGLAVAGVEITKPAPAAAPAFRRFIRQNRVKLAQFTPA